MGKIMFQKILIAVSLTDITEKAYPYAKYICNKFEGENHLLFVARIGRDNLYSTPGAAVETKNEIMRNAEKELDKFAEEKFKGDYSKKTVLMGDPADEIIKYIKDAHIDLVIMGTHGRRGVKKTFLGSVAAEVITRSPAPVVVINPLRVE